MKTRSIIALCAAILLLVGAQTLNARTGAICLQVKCTGTSSICITVAAGRNMEVGFPGIASWKVIPCPTGKGTVSYPYQEYQNVFIHDPVNQSEGMGLINAEAVVNQQTGDADITKYDDTQTFTTYDSWHTALP